MCNIYVHHNIKLHIMLCSNSVNTHLYLINFKNIKLYRIILKFFSFFFQTFLMYNVCAAFYVYSHKSCFVS